MRLVLYKKLRGLRNVLVVYMIDYVMCWWLVWSIIGT